MCWSAALAVLVLWNLWTAGGRETLRLSIDSLAEGAKTALTVGIACATVGLVIGTMTLTGLATTFGQFIVSVGGTSLFLSLVLTMVTCLILGMGIPTIPNYIITSSLAGPALLHLGVPLIVSHMFVFYFGILADLTPPVALAAFAAAPIARESGMKIGLAGGEDRARRLRHPVHGGLCAGADAPGRRAVGGVDRLPAGGRLCRPKVCLAIALWGAAAIGYLAGRSRCGSASSRRRPPSAWSPPCR